MDVPKRLYVMRDFPTVQPANGADRVLRRPVPWTPARAAPLVGTERAGPGKPGPAEGRKRRAAAGPLGDRPPSGVELYDP